MSEKEGKMRQTFRMICGAAAILAPITFGDMGRARAFDVREARAVHAVIILDDSDRAIGETGKRDGLHMRRLLKEQLDAEDLASLVVLSGKQVTRENVLNAVRGLVVDSSATVFVYFSGRGYGKRERGVDRHYLSLSIGEELISRTRLLDELKKKNARLVVLLTDVGYMALPEEGQAHEQASGTQNRKTVEDKDGRR